MLPKIWSLAAATAMVLVSRLCGEKHKQVMANRVHDNNTTGWAKIARMIKKLLVLPVEVNTQMTSIKTLCKINVMPVYSERFRMCQFSSSYLLMSNKKVIDLYENRHSEKRLPEIWRRLWLVRQ